MFLSMAFTFGVVLLYVSQVFSHRAAISELQHKRQNQGTDGQDSPEETAEND